MAFTTDIRIFPQKEMFAVDMAEILDTAIPYNGIIQGCGITFNEDAGTLSMETGRMLIRGRLGVITERGDLVAPVVTGTENVQCHLVASCNLSSLNPFTIEIVTPAVYEEYQQQKAESDADTFNTQDGFDFIDLGTASVSPTSGKIVSWTPKTNTNAKQALELATSNAGGTYLPAGTNINNLGKRSSGWWAYARSDVSGTFPVNDTYGTIGHIQGTSDSFAIQILRSNNQSNSSTIMYVRYKVSGVWGNWQRYVSSSKKSLSINRVGNSYCNATDISYLSAGVKNGFLYLRGNLHLSVSLPRETENVTIARINDWHGAYNAIICAPAQSGFSNLMVQVSESGEIKISNYSTKPPEPTWTYAGWYRFNLIVPVADGYE